jgi:butyrate kinase
MEQTILVINPGSTSTKFALFRGEEELLSETIRHSSEELERFDSVMEQFSFRSTIILETLERAGIDPAAFSAVIGRGGLLHPIPGGVWRVNEAMKEDLKQGVNGEHASNLGGLIAAEIAAASNAPAFIADPVVVDELCQEARLSGHPELPRKSIFHALNQKACARKGAAELGREYERINLIVAHMGGGISVGVHEKGRVVDVNNALNGEGPFSPERSGTLPAGQLVKLCFSGTKSEGVVQKMLKGAGGFLAYLGTADGEEVARRAQGGEEKAALIFRTMAYQVAKEIGSLAPVVKGNIDAIILTGGLAFNDQLTGMIKDRIAFLAPVLVYPGENELSALAQAALRALEGKEPIQEYGKK